MKKITVSLLFTLLVLVMLAPSSWAQASFGVKAGLNVADLKDLEELDSVDAVNSETKTAFVGGGYVKFPFGPMKLQLEGLYSIKGATGGTNLATKAWETKLSYIDVPLLLKYEFPTPGIKPFLYVGGSVSFLMKAEQRNAVITSNWVDIKDGMETIDYGVIVGGGVEIFTLSLDVRYTHGLANLVDDLRGIDYPEESDNELVTQAKNRTFSVMVGVKFF